MSRIHLNEEQLQIYALAGITDPAVMEHVAGCSHCRVQIEAYQTLYSYIREAETPLPDFKMEELILDRLPEYNVRDGKEVRYLYGCLIVAVALLIAGVIGFWSTVCRMFTGIMPLAVVIGLLLFSGIMIMHLMELYSTYQKKLRALNIE